MSRSSFLALAFVLVIHPLARAGETPIEPRTVYLANFIYPPQSMRILGDGRTVAVWNDRDEGVRYVDFQTGKEKSTLRIHPHKPIGVLADGKVLSGGGDEALLVWNPAKENSREELRFTPQRGRKAPFDRSHPWNRSAITPDGNLVIGAAEQILTGPAIAKVRVATVIDRAAKKERAVDICLPADKTVAAFGCGTAPIEHVAVSPDGKLLAIVNDHTSTSPREKNSGRVLVFDLDSGNVRFEYLLNTHRISNAVFAPDSKSLAISVQSWEGATKRGAVLLWEMTEGKEKKLELSKEKFMYSVAFTPDGKHLAAGGEERSVTFWDIAAGKVIGELAHPDKNRRSAANRIAFTADGRTMVTAGFEHDRRCAVCTWDIEAWLKKAAR